MVSRSRYFITNKHLSLLHYFLIILQIHLLLSQPCSSLSPRTPTARPPATDLRSKIIPVQRRGLFGRILAYRPPNSSAAFVETLRDQIVQMERQLRQSEMDAVQLRTLLRGQSSSNRRSTSDTIREQGRVEQNMREIIGQLTKQIQQLRDTIAEMEDILKTEQERTTAAGELLKEEQTKSRTLVNNSRIQMEEMKVAIMKKASLQVEEMEKSHLARFQKELEQIKLESEKAIEQERARSSAAFNKGRKELEEEKRRGQEAVEKERLKTTEAVEKERVKKSEAVEKERVKMRKLVKALAEKEKRNLAKGGGKDMPIKGQNSTKENRRAGEAISKSGTSSTGVARKAKVRGKTKN